MKLKRLISTLVLTIFCTNLFSNPQGLALSNSQVQINGRLQAVFNSQTAEIPVGLGKVQERFSGSTNQSVVLIQDAHAIPEAQTNIARLIQYFEKRFGIAKIGLEGAGGVLDAQIFRSFPDRKRLKKVFNDYNQKGELTGGSAAALFASKEAKYFGVEDPELYDEGMKFYLAAMEKENELSSKLKVQSSKLEEKKKEVYSKELLELDGKLERFFRGELDLVSAGKALIKTQSTVRGPRSIVKAKEIEAFLQEIQNSDTSHLAAEVERIAEAIKRSTEKSESSTVDRGLLTQFNAQYQSYRTSQITPQAFALFLKEFAAKNGLKIKFSSALSGGVEQQKTLRDLEGTQFLKEFEAYAKAVKESLMTSEEQKNLDAKSREILLLEKLVKLELSREEWDEVKETRDKRRETGDKTQETGEVENFLISRPVSLAPFYNFYENAEKRDEALLGNLLKGLGSRKGEVRAEKGEGIVKGNGVSGDGSNGVQDILFPRHTNTPLPVHPGSFSTQSAILVAGGFHAQGITQKLREKNISYVLVMPEIKNVPKETHYHEHMKGNVSWKKYFEVRDGKVNLYEAFVRGTRDQLLRLQSHKVTESQGDRRLGNPGDFVTGDLVTLKSWRDQIIRDLAAQGTIEKAGEYTRFIDELVHSPQSIDRSKSGIHGLSTIDYRLLTKAYQRIDRFIKGFEKLNNAKQVTPENVLSILSPSAMGSTFVYGVFDPAARVTMNSALLPVDLSLRQQPYSAQRSEIRESFSIVFNKGGLVSRAFNELSLTSDEKTIFKDYWQEAKNYSEIEAQRGNPGNVKSVVERIILEMKNKVLELAPTFKPDLREGFFGDLKVLIVEDADQKIDIDRTLVLQRIIKMFSNGLTPDEIAVQLPALTEDEATQWLLFGLEQINVQNSSARDRIISSFVRSWAIRNNPEYWRQRQSLGLSADLTTDERLQQISYLTDEWVRKLYGLVAEFYPAEAMNFAVIAVGGYGREEMSLGSDMDMKIVEPAESGQEAPWLGAVTLFKQLVRETFTYPKIDQNQLPPVQAGASIIEKVKKAEPKYRETEIWDVFAFLEARFVVGKKELSDQLKETLKREISENQRDFIDLLIEAWNLWYTKQGELSGIYEREPNVKNGVGGLKAMHFARWMAEVYLKTDQASALTELEAKGLISEFEKAQAIENFEFLQRLRNVLASKKIALASGGSVNVLSAEVRESVAEALEIKDASGKANADELMRRYYQSALELFRFSAKVMTRVLVRVYPLKQTDVEPLDDLSAMIANLSGQIFRLSGGVQEVPEDKPKRFFVPVPVPAGKRPTPYPEGKILPLFLKSAETGVPLSGQLMDSVEHSVPEFKRRFETEPEFKKKVLEEFKQLLASPQPIAYALKRLHYLTILQMMVPSFKAIESKLDAEINYKLSQDAHVLENIDLFDRLLYKEKLNTVLNKFTQEDSAQILGEVRSDPKLLARIRAALLFHPLFDSNKNFAQELTGIGFDQETIKTSQWFSEHSDDLLNKLRGGDLYNEKVMEIYTHGQIGSDYQRWILLLLATSVELYVLRPQQFWLYLEELRPFYSVKRDVIESRGKEGFKQFVAEMRELRADHFKTFFSGVSTAQIDRIQIAVEPLSEDYGADFQSFARLTIRYKADSDRPGLLFRSAVPLSAAGLNILSVTLWTEPFGGEIVDSFIVSDPDHKIRMSGGKDSDKVWSDLSQDLKEALMLSLDRELPLSALIHRSSDKPSTSDRIQFQIRFSDALYLDKKPQTILRVISQDFPLSLVQTLLVLYANQVSIHGRGKIDTEGLQHFGFGQAPSKADNQFFLTDKGQPLSFEKRDDIERDLRHWLTTIETVKMQDLEYYYDLRTYINRLKDFIAEPPAPTAYIGDVHGEADSLRGILKHIEDLGVNKKVLMGDYIDRGAENLKTIEILKKLVEDGNTTVLLGNHDIAFIKAILGPEDLSAFEYWLGLGGGAVIKEILGTHQFEGRDFTQKEFLGKDPELVPIRERLMKEVRSNETLQNAAKWMVKHLKLMHSGDDLVTAVHAGFEIMPQNQLNPIGILSFDYGGSQALQGMAALKVLQNDIRLTAESESAEPDFSTDGHSAWAAVAFARFKPLNAYNWYQSLLSDDKLLKRALIRSGNLFYFYGHDYDTQLQDPASMEKKSQGRLVALDMALGAGGRGGFAITGPEGMKKYQIQEDGSASLIFSQGRAVQVEWAKEMLAFAENELNALFQRTWRSEARNVENQTVAEWISKWKSFEGDPNRNYWENLQAEKEFRETKNPRERMLNELVRLRRDSPSSASAVEDFLLYLLLSSDYRLREVILEYFLTGVHISLEKLMSHFEQPWLSWGNDPAQKEKLTEAQRAQAYFGKRETIFTYIIGLAAGELQAQRNLWGDPDHLKDARAMNEWRKYEKRDQAFRSEEYRDSRNVTGVDWRQALNKDPIEGDRFWGFLLGKILASNLAGLEQKMSDRVRLEKKQAPWYAWKKWFLNPKSIEAVSRELTNEISSFAERLKIDPRAEMGRASEMNFLEWVTGLELLQTLGVPLETTLHVNRDTPVERWRSASQSLETEGSVNRFLLELPNRLIRSEARDQREDLGIQIYKETQSINTKLRKVSPLIFNGPSEQVPPVESLSRLKRLNSELNEILRKKIFDFPFYLAGSAAAVFLLLLLQLPLSIALTLASIGFAAVFIQHKRNASKTNFDRLASNAVERILFADSPGAGDLDYPLDIESAVKDLDLLGQRERVQTELYNGVYLDRIFQDDSHDKLVNAMRKIYRKHNILTKTDHREVVRKYENSFSRSEMRREALRSSLPQDRVSQLASEDPAEILRVWKADWLPENEVGSIKMTKFKNTQKPTMKFEFFDKDGAKIQKRDSTHTLSDVTLTVAWGNDWQHVVGVVSSGLPGIPAQEMLRGVFLWLKNLGVESIEMKAYHRPQKNQEYHLVNVFNDWNTSRRLNAVQAIGSITHPQDGVGPTVTFDLTKIDLSKKEAQPRSETRIAEETIADIQRGGNVSVETANHLSALADKSAVLAEMKRLRDEIKARVSANEYSNSDLKAFDEKAQAIANRVITAVEKVLARSGEVNPERQNILVVAIPALKEGAPEAQSFARQHGDAAARLQGLIGRLLVTGQRMPYDLQKAYKNAGLNEPGQIVFQRNLKSAFVEPGNAAAVVNASGEEIQVEQSVLQIISDLKDYKDSNYSYSTERTALVLEYAAGLLTGELLTPEEIQNPNLSAEKLKAALAEVLGEDFNSVFHFESGKLRVVFSALQQVIQNYQSQMAAAAAA